MSFRLYSSQGFGETVRDTILFNTMRHPFPICHQPSQLNQALVGELVLGLRPMAKCGWEWFRSKLFPSDSLKPVCLCNNANDRTKKVYPKPDMSLIRWSGQQTRELKTASTTFK